MGALQLDPVEKKPFFHALPGAKALSFGMLGCDFHCAYCQNWLTSQVLRDPNAVAPPEVMSPSDIVRLAHRHGARIVTSTYNEPLITSEWAVAVFREALPEGLVCSYVSNGNATPEVLDYIRPWVSLYKVDLKSFRDRSYRELGGTLERVLWTIRALHERGFWVEIVRHVTAFHQDYKMTAPDATGGSTLLRAAEIGAAEGLRFVYAGNLPGQVGRWEDTRCPGCSGLLIERHGFHVLQNRLARGTCPDCGRAIPGFWDAPALPTSGPSPARPGRPA